ncbi:MAG: NAD(P)-binding domain-containing protein, partial [Steroidobacteraceae bacterium]
MSAPALGTRALGIAAAMALAVCCVAAHADAVAPATPPAGAAAMKVGIIGAGHIGGTLARLWVNAGHEVLVSSRHPEQL